MLTLEQWGQVLEALQHHDNTIRTTAEKQYEATHTAHADHTCQSLLEVLGNVGLPAGSATMALVLLRKKLRDSWNALTNETKGKMCTALLQVFKSIPDVKTKRKVADCIVIVAEELDENEKWNELIPCMEEYATTSKEAADAVMYLMREAIALVAVPMLQKQSEGAAVIVNFDHCPELNYERVNTVFRIADGLAMQKQEESPLFSQLQQLIPRCFDVISASTHHSDEQKEMLESFEEVAATTFFHPCIPQAIETLIKTNSYRALGSFRCFKDQIEPKFVPAMLNFIFTFLGAFDDDVDSWIKVDNDDEEEEPEVDRAAITLDLMADLPEVGESVMQTVFSKVEQLLKSENWKDTMFCIKAISTVSSHMSEGEMLAGALSICVSGLTHAHPRIRHLAWTLLAQVCMDHRENVFEAVNTQQILAQYCKLDEEKVLRVKVRCLASFKYFAADLDQEEASEFGLKLMSTFGAYLHGVSEEQAISAIGMLCTSLGTDAAPFYDELMPRLKSLMHQKINRVEDRRVLAEIFEASSSLGMAVGTEKFAPDAEEIMKSVVQALENITEEDDPVKEYALMAAQRMSYTLKKDFAPFIPGILPQIFSRLKAKVSDMAQDVDESFLENAGEDTQVNLTTSKDPTTGEVKLLVIKTSVLDDLQSSIECLQVMITSCSDLYAPYMQETAKQLLPLIEFELSDEIREIACIVWGDLVKIARTHAPDTLSEMVLGFIDRIVQSWERQKEENVPKLEGQAASTASCIKNAGPNILSTDQVKQIGEHALRQLRESLGRDMEQVSEEDRDELEEYEKSLRAGLSDVMGGLMEHYVNDFVTHLLEPYAKAIEYCFDNGATSHHMHRMGLFMAADVFEHMPYQEALWNYLVPRALADIDIKQEDDIVQAASFDLGLAALRPEFASYITETARRCGELLSKHRRNKKLKDEQRQTACDNLLFCIGNILVKQRLDDQDLWKLWIESLPCREDVEEGRKVHALFTNLVKEQHPGLQNNWKEVLRIFSDIYNCELTDEATDNMIVSLIGQAGQENLSKFAVGLEVKKQKKLLRIWNEAAKGC